MTEYSKEANDWIERMRNKLQSRINSFDKLSDEAKSQYSNIREYFIWSAKQKSDAGEAGPIERDVSFSWDDIKPKTRKELGGKAEAALLVAGILRDEFDIDIVDVVEKNGQPCYGVHDLIEELDWDLEEELGYKKLPKLIKDKNLDRGSALQLYWGFSPMYYTQFENEKAIEDKFRQKAFKLLKQLETRLLADDFKTNMIPFVPEPASKPDGDAWQVPESLQIPNIS